MATDPNNYIGVANIKDALPDTDWGGDYDNLLKILVEASSRQIDTHLGLEPGAFLVDSDEVRYFTGSGTTQQWVDALAATPTTVEMDLVGDQVTYTAISSGDYTLWPRNAALLGQPYYRLDIVRLGSPTYYTWRRFPDSIKITGKFGWSIAVPAYVQQVTTIQAVRWFKRAQQAFQDVGAIRELGQLQYVKGIDPDLQVFLDVMPGRIAI
jgi:hypothetical protein